MSERYFVFECSRLGDFNVLGWFETLEEAREYYSMCVRKAREFRIDAEYGVCEVLVKKSVGEV